MRSQGVDETLLIRYLLGKLDEDEQVQVENRAFADPDYLAALEAAEADLIDAYVRDELTESDWGAFERQFLTSPGRRRKVEFAKALARVATELQEPLVPEPRFGWQTFTALFRISHLKLQFAAGLIALIGLAAGSWLMWENVLMRSRLAAIESQQRDFERRRQVLQHQLAQEQRRAAQLSQQRSAESAPLISSLILTPGIARGQSNVELLALHPSVQIARIEIELESRDEFPRFRAELRTRVGTEVLIFGNLAPRRTSSGNVVSFDVPTSALATGDYELTLKGLSAVRLSEDIGYYYFRVQKR